jgi:hypothetical protein
VANHGLPPNRMGERGGDLKKGTGDVGAGAAKQTGLGRRSGGPRRHLLRPSRRSAPGAGRSFSRTRGSCIASHAISDGHLSKSAEPLIFV